MPLNLNLLKMMPKSLEKKYDNNKENINANINIVDSYSFNWLIVFIKYKIKFIFIFSTLLINAVVGVVVIIILAMMFRNIPSMLKKLFITKGNLKKFWDLI